MLPARPGRSGASYSPYPSRSNTQNQNYQQTPTRSGQSYRPTPNYNSSTRGYTPQSNIQHGPPPQAPSTIHHPMYPPGPLPYFAPPPGQPTKDPTFQTAPRRQAMLTTYPSRLRTGVTGLIQPENITGGPKERELFLAELDRELFSTRSGSVTSTPRDSPAPFTNARNRQPVTTALGRRGKAVNYAEKESDDEEEDSDSSLSELDEPPSDPEDGSYGERGRKRTDRGRGNYFDSQMAARHGKLKKKKEEMDKGWTWLGDRVPGDRVRSQHMRPTKHHYLSEEVLAKEAQKAERLVPITIDFDVPSIEPDKGGIKIKDRFLWNANESHITPYQFAVIFCEDAGIHTNPYARTISDLMEGQLEEMQQVAEIDIMDGEVTPDDVVWSDEEVEKQIVNGHEDEDDEETHREKQESWSEADCRVIINLDVQIYTHILRDRIEWDLSSNLPPTEFAKHYCTELGLTGEAIPLIAHAIVEEILKHKKDCLDLELFSQSHPDEQAKWERSGPQIPRTTDRRGAKGLVGIWRDWIDREDYGPVLVELSMEEMERREQERLRESRRLMRGLAGHKRRR